jgi:glycosyltransferase involved in cell wall biosynthesis
MNIVFTSGRELDYPRNWMIFKLLQKKYKVNYIGRQSGRSNILKQSVLNAIKIFPYLRSQEYTLGFFGFYGHLLVLLVGKLAKPPLIFDAFLSTYDTLCFDRGYFSPTSIPGKFSKWVDIQACSIPKRIILDTRAQADFFHENLGIEKEKLDVLFVGCDEDLFFPRSQSLVNQKIVLFYGSLLPLHNIEVIIEAAKLTEKYGVKFMFIGPFDKIRSEIKTQLSDCQNIQALPPVPIHKIPLYISNASICLGGHFGQSAKASRVIAGKTFQCIAMGKPTIVGDNQANRELLTHGYDAWFCKMNDARALAESILHLLSDDDLLRNLGKNAFQTFTLKASFSILEKELDEIIMKTIEASQ